MAKKKDVTVGFKAGEDFDQWLRDAADELDMSKSAFIRHAILVGYKFMISFPALSSMDEESIREKQNVSITLV